MLTSANPPFVLLDKPDITSSSLLWLSSFCQKPPAETILSLVQLVVTENGTEIKQQTPENFSRDYTIRVKCKHKVPNSKSPTQQNPAGDDSMCQRCSAMGSLSPILAALLLGPQDTAETQTGRTGSGRIAGSDKQAWDQSAEEADRSCRQGGDVRTEQQAAAGAGGEESRSLASTEVNAESACCAGGTRDTSSCHLTRQHRWCHSVSSGLPQGLQETKGRAQIVPSLSLYSIQLL